MSDVNQFFGLEGKAALVIGGGLGMGESASRLLASAGCDVAVLDLDIRRAEGVAESVRTLGRKGVALAADVLAPGAAERVVKDAETALGGLDVVVTIVGQAEFYNFLDLTEEAWELDISRNLRYFAFVAKAAARSMISRGKPGAITAIASVSGMQSAPYHSAYGAAKAGLINLVKSLAVELADYRIRVNAVSPGSIKTPRLKASPGSDWADENIKNSLVPFKQHGQPDDIGNAVLFLSSAMAGYISGQTLAVDGGFTAVWTLGPFEQYAVPQTISLPVQT